ncbi:hypothetical protein H5410_017322 [Solanum commersonii]|uniref:Alanine--tRNA ligase n=1 Tax=Solanum commersonii TaxID=4109 RepID=A0A9J5ZZN7_SOLCO|nr:hypothetical protein H5410_017322 [Solanum commersonii]
MLGKHFQISGKRLPLFLSKFRVSIVVLLIHIPVRISKRKKSRKEGRKEVRTAKKHKKFDSWIQHQQTQKTRRTLPNSKPTHTVHSRKDSQVQRHEHFHSLNSKKDLDTSPRVVDSKADNRSLKRTDSRNKNSMATIELDIEVKNDLQASPRLESSKVENRSLKRKHASNKNSKTMFMEYLEMEKEGDAISADLDLRLERKLAKKLKVKNEKLQGDDDIDMFLEGIPSVVDCNSQLNESLEGTDADTSHKKMKKKTVDEVLDGKLVSEDGKFNPSCVSYVEHVNTDLQTKQKESKKMKRKKTKFEELLATEMRGQDISADEDLALERKLAKKLKVKRGKLLGDDDDMNNLFEGIPSLLDSFEDENTQLVGEAPRKLDKSSSNERYNKEAQGEDHDQEEEQKAESTPYCTDVKAAAGSAAKENAKYVAPRLRSCLGNDSEEFAQIRRRLRGLLNRMSEANVESITSEISTIYQTVGRTFGSQIINEEVLSSCSRGPRGNEQYAAVFAAFVAGMACLAGMDFGAKLLASMAKCFEDEYQNEDNLSVRNLTLLLSYLYTFGVCSSDLIYDFLVTLSKRLTEVDVSTILTVLQACGMKLRGDDPVGMKNFIVSVQNRVNELKSSSGEGQSNSMGKRMEFMLEMICDIKNNKKRMKEETLQLTRIKKWLQQLRVVDILIRGLKWNKLIDPDKRGQWWMSGNIDSTTDVQDVASTIDLEVTETQKMLQLAAAQRMNTDARRAIFCVIMSGEDYIDAFEKLLRLDLQGKQDREIMRVLVECCLQEKAFNKYYCALASKLCSHDKNNKFTLQYCLWDHFKELDQMQLIRSMHLSKFVAEMVASFSLSLAVLKAVDLSDSSQLTPKRIMHFRMLFENILEFPEKLVWNIFTRIALLPEYESLRDGIVFFIRKYVIDSQKCLADKFKIAKKALNNVEGVIIAATLPFSAALLLPPSPAVRRRLFNFTLSFSVSTPMGSQPEVLDWPANKVRETFISFFQGKDHKEVQSSPVVPHNDPTLLFANAGMNQFKPIFLGIVDPNSPLSKLKRACDTQKCIRAGGKHNDLDDVYRLPSERIYATYFGGDEKSGLPADNEARDLWLKFLPPSRVLPFDCKDNFWEMGDTGPCGPCTEIHFDRIGNRDAASFVNNDDPTVIEIWNLVFIQFNREADGSLKPLPAKHVDTGLGFERLTSILQNKMSNYDTDVFLPIFDAIQKATGARPYSGKVGADDVDNIDMAYRVVADHIRTLSIAIADGSCPGNEGREYVLRRILRRAVRYGTEVLKAQQGFFSRAQYIIYTLLYVTSSLVKVVVEVMGDVFPELKQREAHIRDIIADEETSFGRTLLHEAFVLWDTYGFPLDLTQLMAEERGLVVDVDGFNVAMDAARERSRNAQSKNAGGAIDMDADATAALHKKGVAATNDIFKFTWSQLMAEERGLVVDVDGFNVAMDAARERSRNAQSKNAGGAIAMDADATAALHKKGVAATNDIFKFTWSQDHESEIKSIYTGSEFLESAAAGDEVGIILESTSFYAEQGGQIYDTGSLESPSGPFQVCNVQIYGGFILHIGSFSGQAHKFSVGDKVDYNRRTLIAPNHTCTHMLNFTLKEVLGDHIDQKGSIVLPEKLRFDFSHGKPVKPEELRKIESIVNEQIKSELDVFSKEAKLSDAKSIKGLRAVFGEVYPDPVRIVSIGQKVEDLLANPENEEWSSYSAELCGGTHISNTREAKAFALMSEEGIAKGIRRVTAVTTYRAFEATDLASSLEQKVNEAFQTDESLLEEKVTSLNATVERAQIPTVMKTDLKAKLSVLQNQVIKAKKKIAAENIQKAVKAASEMAEAAASGGKAYCILQIGVGLDTAAVREAVVKVMEQKGMAVLVFSKDETANKVLVCAGVPEKGDKCQQLNVKDWLNAALKPLGGKGGGGKGGLAQGQATDISKVDEAMDVAASFAAMKLN